MRVRMAFVGLFILLATAAPASARELPLGPGWLPEARTAVELAPGVTYTVSRAACRRGPTYAPSTLPSPTARGGTRAAKWAACRGLRRSHSRGCPGARRTIQGAARSAGSCEPGSSRQVGGRRPGRRARRRGLTPTRGWSSPPRTADDERSRGWCTARGRPAGVRRASRPALATDVVTDREPLSAPSPARTARWRRINGGYFVIGDADGTPGDLAGVSMLDGAARLGGGRRPHRLCCSTAGRRRVVDALADAPTGRGADGAPRELDGDNRAPGLIRGCGGSGGDTPTERRSTTSPAPTRASSSASTSVFGAPPRPAPAPRRCSTPPAASPRCASLAAARSRPAAAVLAGTGDAADWLRAHAQPGQPIAPARPARRARAAALRSAGRRRQRRAAPAAQRPPGHHRPTPRASTAPEDPGSTTASALRRNPRTLAGVTRDGRLLLVAIDGRRPGYSASERASRRAPP